MKLTMRQGTEQMYSTDFVPGRCIQHADITLRKHTRVKHRWRAGSRGMLAAALCLAIAVPAQAAGWVQDTVGWYYLRSDNSYPQDSWERIGGSWYHFDAQGYMQTGWLQQPEGRYYLDANGAMLSGTERVWDGLTYRFVEDGRLSSISADAARMRGWVKAAYYPIQFANSWNMDYFNNSFGRWQKEAKHRLKKAWGITDKNSALKEFDALMALPTTQQLQALIKNSDASEVGQWDEPTLAAHYTKDSYTYDLLREYQLHPAQPVAAWDLCRAIQLAREAYLAGYIDEATQDARMLTAAQKLQKLYGSREDMYLSYARGYEFWQGSRADFDERWATCQLILGGTALESIPWTLPLG